MNEILTVTVNPAIDLATSVDRVTAGPKLRCGPARVDPGGGGINVARAITKLGGRAKAIIAVGGATGEHLIEMVLAECVTPVPVTVAGRTRQNLAVTDASTGEQFRFSLFADTWVEKDEANFVDAIKKKAARDAFVVLSGGVAPGVSEGFHQRVQLALSEITEKIIVDTCNPALSHHVAAPRAPFYILRIDRQEAEMVAGRELETLQDSVEFGLTLIDRGVARIVVIGRGSQGSLLVSRDQRLFCYAPKVKVQSKIGAGDAFVGGLTLSLSRGEPIERALQWGVAAASATVATEGTALCTSQAVEALLPNCPVETIAA